ncbi:MAG: tetratricopeptide repeat protein, partial [Candidatus Omnitrophica bacterium]|nr:tetratricopeptide repeat protein [Candidatus Omnitrophota bacterium]
FRNGEHGGFEEAEGILNKVLKKDPKNIDAYLLLAGCLMLQQRAEEAISLLNDALVKDPNNLRILNELGIAYKTHGKWNEAEKIFNEIIDKDPENYAVYVELGDCYIDQNRYKEAEIILKRGLKINPTYEPLYTALGLNYRKVKDDMGIEELSKMIIDNNVENDRLLGFVATSFTENNNYKEAKIYYEKANNQRLNYYNNATRHNYLELKEILKQRNIKLVCAQYPMRSVDALKKLFLRTEGMIFIDNEKLFKDALMENKYEDLFTDNFGGEFGHATAKGNKLLAENIANVIIEEVFK